MKSLPELSKIIWIMASVFLFITAGLFYFLLSQSTEKENLVCETGPTKFFCGTENLSQKTNEGKHLFNNNCAACHKLYADMTGPALHKTDSIVFSKWMFYLDTKIDATKLEKMGLDYHRNLSRTNFEISDLDKIYQYIKE